jgi:hypothetical protein
MAKVNLFPADFRNLNKVTEEIYKLDQDMIKHFEAAEKEAFSAFKCRFEMGKILFDNETEILEFAQTWADFADIINKTPSVISNNLRGYRAFNALGINDWDGAVELLRERQIRPLSSNYEKIGKLLSEPEPDDTPKTREEKDLRRLEQISGELTDITQRNDRPDKHSLIVEEAVTMLGQIEDFQRASLGFEPDETKWRSHAYLEMVRNWGRCEVSGEFTDYTDPHHTYVDGLNSAFGVKLPDYLTIPVSRELHMKIEAGQMSLDNEEILRILVKCMARFISIAFKSDE